MIASNIDNLKRELPDHVDLVAVSKTKPAQMILDAMANGHLDFGENKFKNWSINMKRCLKQLVAYDRSFTEK